MIDTSNLTKVPTTYAGVRLGDVIDGEKIVQIESEVTMQGQFIVRLGFDNEDVAGWAWGPWSPADRPVSVYR